MKKAGPEEEQSVAPPTQLLFRLFYFDFRVGSIFNTGVFMSHRCLLKIMIIINFPK